VLRLLDPDQVVATLFDIDLDALAKRGIKGLILDLDNTIIERGAPAFTPEVLEWLEDARRRGFKLAIVSNNRTERAVAMAREHGIPAVFRAVKPRRRPFRKALRRLGLQPHEVAVVGDQLFTDVFGGNRLGMYTILTRPLPGPEFIGTRLITRKLEKLFLPRIWRRHGFVPGEQSHA